MIKLRKLLAIVYLLAFVVLLTGLVCYWFALDPVLSLLHDYRGSSWLDYTVWALLAIVVFGTLGYAIRTISQRGKNTFQKTSNELGAMQISRAAIVHEVNGVIDAHPEVKRSKTIVTIKNRRRPYAKVFVRLSPRGSLEMPVVVANLQREIKDAVERLTGNDVRSVTIDVRRGKDAEGGVSKPETTMLAGDTESHSPDSDAAVPNALESADEPRIELAAEADAASDEAIAQVDDSTAFEGDGLSAEGQPEAADASDVTAPQDAIVGKEPQE